MSLRKMEVTLVTSSVSSWLLRKAWKLGVKVCMLAFAQDTVHGWQLASATFKPYPSCWLRGPMHEPP